MARRAATVVFVLAACVDSDTDPADSDTDTGAGRGIGFGDGAPVDLDGLFVLAVESDGDTFEPLPPDAVTGGHPLRGMATGPLPSDLACP